MQPGVTVVLASIWLVVVAVPVGVLGAATHLTFDQYSPLPPYNDGVYRRVESQLDWKDRDPVEDRPLDLSIGPRTPISANEPLRRLFEGKYLRGDLPFTPAENGASLSGDRPSLGEDKESWNFAGTKFTNGKVDHSGTKATESFSREIRPAELEDPFVADDTFQDQGPGSVEIYKLDLFKEKALLSPAPTARPSPRNKSKAPKKTGRVNWKPKTPEYKTTSPKIHYRQSNFFDELRTEVPPNGETFGIGGVPELQVGCEGLEASSHKLKRSIDLPGKEKSVEPAINPWHDVTPISLDMDYELSSEEGYEEMDELVKLKRLENTTKPPKQNRGDMDATLHRDEFFNDKRRSDKLPVRGDLGKTSAINGSTGTLPLSLIGDQKTGLKNGIIKPHKGSLHAAPVKREAPNADLSLRDSVSVKLMRKLLWLDDSSGDHNIQDRKRSKRQVWGFGEDEGVVASNELETENERRRQLYERRRQEEARRSGQVANHTNSEISEIRKEYERMLAQKEREEEERRRRLQQSSRREPSNAREDDERRREDERKRQYEENLRSLDQPRSQLEEEERLRRLHMEDMKRRQKWHEEERRRQETESTSREYHYRPRTGTDEELRKERLREEEFRRREESRLEEEKRRRQQLEADKRLRQQGEDRRRQQEEEERRRQQEEEARRRRQQEEVRRREQEEERRQQLQEEERRQLLGDEETRRKEQNRWREEAQRRQQEERRNRTTQSPERRLSEEDRRRLEERKREWMMKRRQEEEEERKRQQQNRNEIPSNLVYPSQQRPNDTNQETEMERRMREQQERQRDQKLREYVQRNQPINVDRYADRRRAEEERRRYQEAQQNSTRRREEEVARRRMDEQRRKQEEERKLQEYIRRNQPVQVGRTNESYPRNWLENRRIIDEARQYDRSRYPSPDTGRRNHGPSAPTSIDPRSYTDEARRRQEAWRLEEERRTHERQRHEEAERRREALRREEEYRRLQSRRYEEDRKRQEAARLEDERRRKELIEEETTRSQARRTRPLENGRPEYEDRRRVLEHRRQDTSLIPGNLVLDESRRAMERERQRQELERSRLEAERRGQEERRVQKARQKEQHARGMASEQRRRHEEARLNALPVSARIILHSEVSPPSPRSGVISRGEFGNEIDFLGINPNRPGLEVSRFPVPATARPPSKSPGPCVWAVVQCCPSNSNRLVTCFESLGCPGVNWDPNPCRGSIADAAREEVMKFYAAAEGGDRF